MKAHRHPTIRNNWFRVDLRGKADERTLETAKLARIMSIIIADASEERGRLLTREIILPRLRASSVARFAVLEVGIPTFFGFGRRRLDQVRWLVPPGICEEQTLLAAPIGEDVYWGSDTTALIEQLADLYGALELLDPSDGGAREARTCAMTAQQALGGAGLPVAMSISHDMDLLVVAGPESLLRPLLSPRAR